MTDLAWPTDIVAYQTAFYLQPYSGGTESPFSRKTKVYGLGPARWVCRLQVRGGFASVDGPAGWARRLDAFLAKLRGRENRVKLWDHRCAKILGSANLGGITTQDAMAPGDTSVDIVGAPPSSGTEIAFYAGDRISIGNQLLIVTEDAYSDVDGGAHVEFEPTFRHVRTAGSAVFVQRAYAFFRLVSDDAPANPGAAGELAEYTLEFVEDL